MCRPRHCGRPRAGWSSERTPGGRAAEGWRLSEQCERTWRGRGERGGDGRGPRWRTLRRRDRHELAVLNDPDQLSLITLRSTSLPHLPHPPSRPRPMLRALLRAPGRVPPVAIRPVLPLLPRRPLSSSAPVAALPVHRPAASQRRRDPARILTIPRREERSERPRSGHAATGDIIVEMPEDREGVLRSTHAAVQLLGQPGLVITR
jgi:hypothetical protein